MSQAILPEALETLRTPLEEIRPDPTNPKYHDSTLVDTLKSLAQKEPQNGAGFVPF